MSLQVITVPAFADNYLWLVRGLADPHAVVAVDPGDAAAIEAALSVHQLRLAAILVTHHHRDHVGGVMALATAQGVPVYGPAAEDIEGITHPLTEGDTVDLAALGLRFAVWAVPGHTLGHLAYVGHGAVFCGDTLFSGGCGRLFEGTPEQMHQSLSRLGALPADTAVYCAHEYTASNLRFALVVEPGNPALQDYAADVAGRRADGLATVPTRIDRELAVNPFLRVDVPEVRASAARHAGRAITGSVDALAVLREWKNGFRG